MSLGVRRHRVEYRIPAAPTDELMVSMWAPGSASSDPELSGDWLYEIRRTSDDTLLVRARSTWLWTPLEADEGRTRVYGSGGTERRAARKTQAGRGAADEPDDPRTGDST
jgi:hypothetical protein